MKILGKLVRIAPVAILAFAVGVPLYGLPATLSLPRGQRPGVDRLTLAQAAQDLRASGQTGWALVEAARALVGQRMQYCRRNSYDSDMCENRRRVPWHSLFQDTIERG